MQLLLPCTATHKRDLHASKTASLPAVVDSRGSCNCQCGEITAARPVLALPMKHRAVPQDIHQSAAGRHLVGTDGDITLGIGNASASIGSRR